MKDRIGFIGIALVIVIALVGCVSDTQEPPTATPVPKTSTPNSATAAPEPPAISSPTADAASLIIERTKDITYANVDGYRSMLDVYVPSKPGPWPVVIVAHGVQQHRTDFADLSEAIASEGAVVYNIYVNFTVPFITGIQRIACAVRFARATAADYGGDPSRITLVGNSAGADTGAVVALAGDDFEGDCVVTDGSALLDALVGFEGDYNHAMIVPGGRYDHSFLKDEDPELWHAIDPYSHIGGNPDLQVRLVHGDDEDVQWYETPLEQSIEFHQALADAGYDVELIIVEGAPHISLTDSFYDAFAVTVQQVMELARGSSR